MVVALTVLGALAAGCVTDARPVAVRDVSDRELDVYYRTCRFEPKGTLEIYEADAISPGPQTLVWQGEVPVKSDPFPVPITLEQGKTYTMREAGESSHDLVGSFSAESLRTPAGLVTYLRHGATVDSPVGTWTDVATNWCANYELPFLVAGGGVVVVALLILILVILWLRARRRRKAVKERFAGASEGQPVGVMYSRRPAKRP